MTAAISRSTDHKYTYQGVTYPGVTSILKVLDKSDALMGWAARQTAEAALGMFVAHEISTDMPGVTLPGEFWDPTPLKALYQSVGPEGVVKALTARSGWKRDEAAQLGTQVHDLADKYVSGTLDGPLGLELSDGTRKRVEAYAEWWKASGWTLRLSEAYLIAPESNHVVPGTGYGGTLDLLCYDRDGKTVLADLKTGKGVYREASLQLAAYGGADFISPVGSPTVYPMPKVERYVILHVTESGVREIEVPVDSLTYEAWYACIALHKWTQETKGRLT